MTEHLHTVAGLQEKEQQLQRQLAVNNRQLIAAQEDGETDRIRLLQAEDEILSLQVTTLTSLCTCFCTHYNVLLTTQAELDATLMEFEEAGRCTVAATGKAEALEERVSISISLIHFYFVNVHEVLPFCPSNLDVLILVLM